MPLSAESAGPVAEPPDERSQGVSQAAPAPLAAASGEQPQQSLGEAEGPQGVQPQHTGSSSSSQGGEAERPQGLQPQQTGSSSSSPGLQGKAAAEEIVHIDVGDGEDVPHAAANGSQQSREEYVSWRMVTR